MEQELSQTTMAQSFERAPSNKPLAEDEMAPVDVNLNLVKNLLTSLVEQTRRAGTVVVVVVATSQCNKDREPPKEQNMSSADRARKRKYGNCMKNNIK
jgi:hypothetical protein